MERLETLSKIRKGSRLSRVFRPLFGYKRLKAVLGANLALLVILASVLSPSASALASIADTEVVAIPADTVALTTNVRFRAPVDEVKTTQGFHFFHQAVDLDGVTGDPIYPIAKGVVESTVYSRFALGKHIVVSHGDGLKSTYAHLSKIEAGVGETVDTNQVIGRLGATGRSFGDHLHLEVTDNGRHINPASILPLR